MDHGAKQARYGKGGLFGRNTNKLVRAKTGPSVGEKISNLGGKISSTIGDAFDKEKPTPTTPNKNEMVNSQILNEYDSPASRLQSEFSLNQDAMQALVAGGSRPMHQGTSSQIDPMTGMPIVAGGQPPINPAFGGAIQNSGIPNYNPGMNMANITQARVEDKMREEKYREELINTFEGKRINEALGVNYTPNPNPAKNYDKGFEPFGSLSGQAKSIDSRKIKGATVLGGNQPTKQSGLGAIVPGQFNAKTPQDKTMPKGAAVDGTLVAKMGEAAAKAAPIVANMKIVENLVVPDTSYKIGNKGPRKSMVVKRNK